jgi:CxxC motif-containing protein (DUF1111 family)
MASPFRSRVAQGFLLALALVPLWKSIEPFFRPGPKAISEEASRLGRELFTHQWTEHDPLASGDGLGPVFNASSCVECHNQGGAGGGGLVDKNVTVYSLARPHPAGFIPRSGVVHQKAISSSFWETVNLVDPSLPRQPSIPLPRLIDRKHPRSTNVLITQRNTPALFGAGEIDAIADDTIVSHQRVQTAASRVGALMHVGGGASPDRRPETGQHGLVRAAGRASNVRGRVARLRDGRVGRFGWKLEFATLNDFVKAACANELGLSNPGRPQATPLGKPDYRAPGTDLTEEQCSLMTDFIRSLPRPVEAVAGDSQLAEEATMGKLLFGAVGCADCHLESLGSVKGLYSDLLLHDMGVDLQSSGGYRGPEKPAPPSPSDKSEESEEPSPGEWRTPPLWGVADSAPYLHDGRAPTLEAAIDAHGGEAGTAIAQFHGFAPRDQRAIVTFLKTLHAPSAQPISADSHTLAAR